MNITVYLGANEGNDPFFKHLQVHMVVHKFHPQLRSAAGAFDMGRGGSQGKQVPLHNDRLTAGGADISQGTLWLFNRHNEFPFCGSPASAPDGPRRTQDL